ncbi:MAG: 2-C-methyl-D-erythritol 2,4-cyclodiphosphate synthase [Clostridiales bacterium]|nr:2-C-methyl-D-erythritol 2,4-cyclodiphosphate synthase [Clostridiales bacterium]
MMRIGFGYDVHKLTEGRKCIICGVDIPHAKGLLGHSDADVAIHALCDALLGAAALGDIGKLFPDNDDTFKGIDSRILLRNVRDKLKENGYVLGNADITIAAQKPKLMPHIDLMRKNLASDLDTNIDRISVKATTTEKLGFEGREEGISAYAVVLINEI